MIEYLFIFTAVFVIDILYTFYLKAVQDSKPLIASGLASIVYVLACVVVINYTTDNWLLIPAALGAFCGTYVGIRLKRNDQT
jgi:CHASE2 domain-containing sensor protein